MFETEENAPESHADHRPLIAAIPYSEASGGKISYLLSEPERAALARIASRVRFTRGAAIFREGEPAQALYNITSGVVRSSRTAAGGSRSILAFFFPDDVFGLAEEGLYVNTATAVTAVLAWRIPIAALERLLRQDAILAWHLLVKEHDDLRGAQRHSLILAHHGALARLAMFLLMLARSQEARNESASTIALPMTRSDIADYLGLTLAAVSRSFRALESRALVAFADRRHLRIRDRAQLQSLVGLAARADELDLVP